MSDPTTPAPAPAPVDPSTVPMNLTGMDPSKFKHEEVLAGLQTMSQEEVDAIMVDLNSIRSRIHDSRTYLATLAMTVGKYCRVAVEVAKVVASA